MSQFVEIDRCTDAEIRMPFNGYLIETKYCELYGTRWKHKGGSTYVYECNDKHCASTFVHLHNILDKKLINSAMGKETVLSITYRESNEVLQEAYEPDEPCDNYNYDKYY